MITGHFPLLGKCYIPLGMQAYKGGYSVVIGHTGGLKDRVAGGSNASASLSFFG